MTVEGSPQRPPKWQALEGSARRWQLAAAATALLCLLAVLHQARSYGVPLSLLQPAMPQQPQQVQPGRKPAAAGALLTPPLPCLFNTLLRMESVQWSATPDGAADHLSVAGCPLRRYTVREARRCLAGKRLVFVGDSVTRYQYLTLLHFLERGRWPAPLGGVPGEPSVANEHEWPGWNDFLRGGSALFGGREACDCYRQEARPGFKPPESKKFENRFYRDPSANLSVSHFTYTTKPHTVHGHFGFPPYEGEAGKGRRPCAPATCSAPADWKYGLVSALAGPIKGMRPTHLVINSGLWGSSNAFGDAGWERIAQAGRLAVSESEGRVIWKTTTATAGPFFTSRDHDALALRAVGDRGWDVLDSFALTRPLASLPNKPMWDARHFQAVVYRELNLYLLNMICHPVAQ